MDYLQQWAEMLSAGMKTQQSLFGMLNEQLGATHRAPFQSGEDANAIFKFYQELANSLSAKLMEGVKAGKTTGNDSVSVLSDLDASEQVKKNINKLWESNQEIWRLFSKSLDLDKDKLAGFYKQSLERLMNPSSWVNAAAGDFDTGIEKLSEGPAFAGVWDVDKKIVKAQESWVELRTKSNAYHSVILASWSKAYNEFLTALNEKNSTGERPEGWREVTDMWTRIANDELLKMHRSEDFLTAQRELIRAGMTYRLDEQDVAEDICQMMHIPTRSEVDEVQKSVVELRRQVRALKRELDAPEHLQKETNSTANKSSKSKAVTKATTGIKKTTRARSTRAK